MTIGPKGGPLEKNFFETWFYEFKMIVLMKENVLDGFKAIWSLIKNFQNWSKKSPKGDNRTKGMTIGKNFFETCFYEFKMIVLMKENILDGFKAIWSRIKNFQNWSKKSLRGDHRTKRGTIGKKFFETCFYEFKMIVLTKENVLDGFKAIWSLIKNFQNRSKKSLRGDHRTKGGTIGKKFFGNVFLWVQNDCFDERKRFGSF